MELQLTLNENISALTQQNNLPTIKTVPSALTEFQDLAREVQDLYGWRRFENDAFEEHLKSLRDVKKVNRCYWELLAGQVEAFDIVMFWRSAELLEDVVYSLNNRRIAASAILSRSLMELGITALWNLNMVDRTLTELRSRTSVPVGLYTNEELWTHVDKMTHGTRIPDLEQAGFPTQTNIMTYIQKLAKNPYCENLESIYFNLCDVAHPNVLGNARFGDQSAVNGIDGSETLTLSRKAITNIEQEVTEKALWALGWSAVATRNAFLLGQGAVKSVLDWTK